MHCDVILFIYLGVIFSALFTGAHFNPLISLAMAVRRELRIEPVQLPWFVLGQLLGVCLAVGYQFIYSGEYASFANHNDLGQDFQAGLGEVLGVALMVWVVLVQSNPNTAPTMDESAGLLLIVAGVGAARLITPQSAFMINPCILAILCLTAVLKGEGMPNIWPWIIGDFLGLLLGFSVY